MSRLYPGWGSGGSKNRLRMSMRATYDSKREDSFNCGDKLILPQDVLKELIRLKLELPILLSIRKIKTLGSVQTSIDTRKTIICGILEFSGRKRVALLPKLIWKKIGGPQRGKTDYVTVSISSLTSLERDMIPKAISCRFKPERGEFLENLLNEDVNIVVFMEHELKRYTSLRLNDYILVSFNKIVYRIKITVLNPKQTVSLLGDVDVLIDFAAPDDQENIGRIRPKKVQEKSLKTVENRVRSFQHNSKLRISKKFGGKGIDLKGIIQKNEKSSNIEKENKVLNQVCTGLSLEDIRQKRLAFLSKQVTQIM